MNGKIPVSRMWLTMAAIVCAIGVMAISVAAASAASVVYNNLNTVPSTVNGHADEDTYSAAPFEFPFGGLVEFSHRPGVIKTLTADVDSFTCEHGTYQFENCYTAHPGKKFAYALSASIYEVGAGNEPGTLVTTATAMFKIPYRPTTNVSCPATPEGKGFGINCDVGGYLAKVTFKHFNPTSVLPEKAIVLINKTGVDSETDVVNIGMQTAYKEWDGEFVAEPPADGGKPAVGTDPLPEDVFVRGKLESAPAGEQPALEVTAKT